MARKIIGTKWGRNELDNHNANYKELYDTKDETIKIATDSKENTEKALKKVDAQGEIYKKDVENIKKETVDVAKGADKKSDNAEKLAKDTNDNLNNIVSNSDSNPEVVQARKAFGLTEAKTLNERLDMQFGDNDEFRPEEISVIKKMKSEFYDRGINVLNFIKPLETSISNAYNRAVEYGEKNNIRVIFFPSGNHEITETLNIKSRFKLFGQGSNQTIINNNSGMFDSIRLYSNASNVFVSGLRVTGNKTNYLSNSFSGFLIDGNNTTSERIKGNDVQIDYHFYGMRNKAFLWNSLFKDFRVKNCGYSFFNDGQSTLTTEFQNFYSDEPDFFAIYSETTLDAKFSNSSFGGNPNKKGKFMHLGSRSKVKITDSNFEGQLIENGTGSIVLKEQSSITIINSDERKNKSDDTSKDAYFVELRDNAKVYARNTNCSSGDGKVKTALLFDKTSLNTPDNSLYNPFANDGFNGKITNFSTLKQYVSPVYDAESPVNEPIFIPNGFGTIMKVRLICIGDIGYKGSEKPLLQIKQAKILTEKEMLERWLANGYIVPFGTSDFLDYRLEKDKPVYFIKNSVDQAYGKFKLIIDYSE